MGCSLLPAGLHCLVYLMQTPINNFIVYINTLILTRGTFRNAGLLLAPAEGRLGKQNFL